MDEVMQAEEEARLLTYDGNDRVVSSTEFWELIKNKPKTPKFMTGISSLDKAIDGFEPGELIIISGPTAMGKTTLCKTIMRNMGKEGHKSLFFTFENLPSKIVEEAVEKGDVLYLPLEHKSKNLPWLKERCLEARLKHPYDFACVFIDHLHYVIDMASRQNMSIEIGQTMRFIKQQIAIELELPVFVVCHVGKIPFGEELSLNHLRDSSFVAQEADTVLMVCRRTDVDESGEPLKTIQLTQNLATVKIEKSRRVGTMGEKINLVKVNDVMEESAR